MATISEEKDRLRKAILGQRDRLDTAARVRGSRRIHSQLLNLPELHEARVVFCFVSHASEVDTHDLIDALLASGKTVLVPRILPGRIMAAIRMTTWTELSPGQLGILTPQGLEPYQGEINVCIIPGVGFTLRGERLGHGRGYYDQWFATHYVTHKIAIAYTCQLQATLPIETHDVAVDMIVTEERVIRM